MNEIIRRVRSGSPSDLAEISRLNEDQLRALIEHVGTHPPSNNRERLAILQSIYGRWAELNPDHALVSALKEEPWIRQEAAAVIVSTLALSDPDAAWAMATSINNVSVNRYTRNRAISSIAKTNPSKAFELYKTDPSLDLRALMAEWARKEPSAAIAAARTLGSQRADLISTITSNWFQSDREGALAYLSTLKGMERTQATNSVLRAWSKQDPESAAAWALNLGTHLNRDTLEALLHAWGKRTPERAIEWASSSLTGGERKVALKEVYAMWLDGQPSAAIAWMESLEDASLRSQLSTVTPWSLVWEDPHKALEFARAQPAGNADVRRLIPEAIERLAGINLEEARAEIAKLENPGLVIEAQQRLLNVWIQKDPEAALLYARETADNQGRARMIAQVVGHLAYESPQRALQVATDLEPGSAQQQAMGSAVRTWARSSPEEAAAYVQTIDDPAMKNAALGALIPSWSHIDLSAAAEFTRNLPQSEGAESGMRQIAQTWASRDPQEAFRWAQDLEQNQAAEAFVEEVLGRWAENAPAQAAEALQGSDLGWSTPGSYQNISALWANQDAPAAAEWAVGIRDENSRSVAYATIVSQWAREDPDASATWIETMPDGKSRDRALQAYGEQLVRADPTASLDWVQTIGDEDRRWESIQELTRDWRGRDAEAAEQWVSDHPELTEQQKAELLEDE